MNGRAQVILHLGLHKTATGTLQRQFFPACPGINVLTTAVPQMRQFVAYATRTDPLYFDADHGLSLLDDVLDPDRTNLLSNESFSGPPYAGVIESGLDHRSPVLQNLRSTFPQAKAILVLRRQDGLARSMYRQYLKSGGTRSVRRFFGLGSGHAPLFSLDRFLFARYVESIHESFPRGMLLLAFEEFVQDQAAFLQRLVEFVGIDLPDVVLKAENVTSMGPFGLEVSRLLNHLFRSFLNPAGLIPGVRVTRGGRTRRVSPLQFVHDKWPGRRSKGLGQIGLVAQEILELSQADNRSLDRRFQLGLSRYDYY